jgi:hypothetical protein
MALRGDLVGEAYVRITADTSAMRDAIAKDGDRAGKDWANSFSDSVEKQAAARQRAIRQKLAAGLSDTKDLDELAKKYDSVTAAANDFKLIIRDLNKHGAIATGQTRKYITTINRWETATNEARIAAFNLAEQEKASAAVAREHAATRVKAVKDVDRAVRTSRWGRFMDNSVTQTDRLEERFGRFNTTLGRVFGKGSRNNFVNWVGSMVAGLSRLGTEVITFPIKAIAHISNSFSDAFSASRLAGAGKFLSAGRGILGVFGGKGGLIGTLIGAGVGLFAISKVLPGVISLLTSLGGVVSALVGSIGIGLVGALLAVGPASIGAVAGLGTVFGVINSFAQDKKNTKFWESVFETPFRKFSLQFAPKVKTFLTGIRSGIARLLTEMKPAVNSFFSNWDRTINDPTTQSALGKWADSLGRIARSVNVAFTSFVSGLIGFFVPVLPYAEKLATYISTIATRFNAWANSTPGQNAIADFMKGAWENARLVKDIIVEIGSILGTVFSSGDPTGKSFLDGILGKLEEIDAFLKTPAGRAKLDEWFEGVKGIGEDLGDIALSVGEIIKNFNTPEAQKSATQIMDALVAIADLGEKLSRVADAVGTITGFLANPALAAFFKLSGIIDEDRKNNPAPPPSQKSPSDVGLGSKGAFTDLSSLDAELTEIERRKAAISKFKFTISVDQSTWLLVSQAIAQYQFTDKQVPIGANPAAWDATKGTVAGYVFDSKQVAIEANAEPLYATLREAQRKIRALTGTTVRIAGITQGGITMARGGILTQPTWTHPNVLAGEAGREAYVPLDRPLNQIDPAVRALAAFAQGKMSMASGGVVGASRMLTISPGAITVISPHSDPALVAESVMDRFVALG